MQKEILEQLKTKFTGVSEQILDRVAKKLAETVNNQEDVKTAVDGVTFQKVLESYGDSRATDATKTAVLNYEKKHGLKDGLKVEPVQPVATEPTNAANDTPEWAKALVKSVATLSEKVSYIESQGVATTRKQQMSEVLSKIPEKLRKGYERIDLEKMDDEAFGTLLAQITDEVGDLAQEVSAKGAAFAIPSVRPQGAVTGKLEASKEEVEAVSKLIN